MISRRDFIRKATIATGGIILANSSYAHLLPGKKPKVIIIGAGFAGLAAAYYLHKQNIEFIVLESRTRIGGRVFSHTMDEAEKLVVELGAEWVGASHQRLIALTDEMGLKLENNQFDTHLIFRGAYFKKNEWDYSSDWKNKFEKLLKTYPELSSADKIKLDKIDWWRYLVNNGCEGRDLDLRELTDSTDFGETIRSVSAFAAMAEYAESSPKNEMDFKINGGNGLLAQKLSEKIGTDKIKTGYKVERIEQGKKVIVYCQYSGNNLSSHSAKIKRIFKNPFIFFQTQV